MPQPIHYAINERDFDLSLIPEAGRKIGTDAFRKYVTKYLQQQYEHLGGETTVEFEDGNITVTWIPTETDREPMEAIIDLLKGGRYDQAAPMLEALLQANPKDHDALYNLGMVYSDQGRLDNARDLLRRAAEVAPDHANSWVALGVAALRANDKGEARKAIERAVALEPKNPFALRTLGSLHAMSGDNEQAVKWLRSALDIAPNDAIILLTLAQTLIELSPKDNASEADLLLHRALDMAPQGEVAEKAKDALRELAGQTFRSKAVSGLRPDAVMYCVDALERFQDMDRAKLTPILLEMATLGQGGLPVNDSEKKFTLRSLPGQFTALNIVCMMHVGMKMIDSNMGSGFDIDPEYEAALSMRAGKR